MLADMGSANGTFVNNQKVQDAPLRPAITSSSARPLLVFSTAGREQPEEAGGLAEKISMIAAHRPRAVVGDHQDHRRERRQPHPRPAGEGQGALAADRAGQPRHHVRGQPGRQPYPRPRTSCSNASLELIFRSIEADRGCVMLRNPDSGELEPKAVRWRSQRQAEEKHRRQPDHHRSRAPREAGRAGVRRRAGRALQHRPEHRPLRHPRGDLRADEGPARNAGRALPRHA